MKPRVGDKIRSLTVSSAEEAVRAAGWCWKVSNCFEDEFQIEVGGFELMKRYSDYGKTWVLDK